MSDKDLKYKISADNSAFTKSMGEAINQTGQMDAKMSSMSKGGMMGAIVGGNLLTNAISTAASAVVDFGKDSLRAFGQQEQFLTSLKTMFHGNAVEAEVLNDKLKQFAATTPFELTEIQDATKMMIAYGSTSTGVTDELRMLGDVSSGVGSSLSEIGYLYGTLRTQGQATWMDIRQFAGRGVPIIQALAKQFKVTDDQVKKLVEDGKVGFKDVEGAFKDMTKSGGQFFGMMENQSKTLDGQISNMSDAFEQLKVNVGSSFADMAKDVISSITGMINEANAKLSSLLGANKTLNKKGLGLSGAEQMFGQSNIENAMYQEQLTKATSSIGSSGKGYEQIRTALTNEAKRLTTQYREKGGLSSGKELSPEAKAVGMRMALLQDALVKLDDTESNRIRDAKKSTEAGKKSGGTSSSKLGTTAEISGAKPQSIIINITKLIESLNLSTTNLTESASKIKEEVAKALLEAVNDVNTLARTA